MTLRQVLISLASDGASRSELLADPASVLARNGFDGLSEDLLGTALVHHVDTAAVDQLDELVPLLDRFAPIPGVARTPTDTDPNDTDPNDTDPNDTDPVEFVIDDPGLVFDDLAPSADRADAADGDTALPLVDSGFGTGSIPVVDPGPHDLVEVPSPSDPTVAEWQADDATPIIDGMSSDGTASNGFPPDAHDDRVDHELNVADALDDRDALDALE